MSAPTDCGRGFWAYTNHGCRCGPCVEGWRAYRRDYRARRRAAGLSQLDPAHGTATGYTNHGCRCGMCTRAHADQAAIHRARRLDLLDPIT